MIFQITDKCFRGCSHCMLDCKPSNNGFMNIDDYKRVLMESKYSMANVILSGGEPMLHPDILEFIAYARRTKRYVMVLTSGVNLIELTKLSKDIISDEITIQITNDSRYYPQNDEVEFGIKTVVPILKELGFSVCITDSLAQVRSMGRAKDNNIKPDPYKTQSCGNSILMFRQEFDKLRGLTDYLDIENLHLKFCLTFCGPDMTFYLGECKHFAMGNIFEAHTWENCRHALENARTRLSCNICGENNIDSINRWLKDKGHSNLLIK